MTLAVLMFSPLEKVACLWAVQQWKVLQKMNRRTNVELARYAARHHLDE